MRLTELIIGALSVAVKCSAQSACPVEVIDFNPVSLFRDFKHPALTIKVKNTSGKDIRGFKVQVGYFDATEDLNIIPVEFNAHKSIKNGREAGDRWAEGLTGKSAVGWVLVVKKVLFEDGSVWNVEASNVCYGERWNDKKYPRLTKLPWELFKSPNSENAPPK